MNLKLLQLLADNRKAGKAVASRVIDAAKDGDEAVLYLYDPIVGDRATAEYFGCVCAQDLVPQIDGIKAKTLRLRVNSPGGDVFAMQAIMNALRNLGARKIAQIDGVAASAATGIAAVCDEVVMEKGSLFMIHNSHGLAYGDKNELKSMAEVMDKVDAGMVDAYTAKTGKDAAQITAWMDAETWFTAEQAVEAGFANSVSTSGKGVKAAAEWNLSAFANAPKVAPEPIPEPDYITEDHRARQQQRLQMALRLTSS